jgi:hypothetical protein
MSFEYRGSCVDDARSCAMPRRPVPLLFDAEDAVPKRECMNIKVDAELVRKAKVIAAAKHVTLSDYVSRLLRGLIEADLASVAAGLTVKLEALPRDSSERTALSFEPQCEPQ